MFLPRTIRYSIHPASSPNRCFTTIDMLMRSESNKLRSNGDPSPVPPFARSGGGIFASQNGPKEDRYLSGTMPGGIYDLRGGFYLR